MTLKKIITHDGNFHVDEILAVTILQRIFPDTEIVRTRDYKLIDQLLQTNSVLAVVDVYGKYDGEIFFDHHQRGFDKKIDVLCSSAGLVFLKYRDKLFPDKTGIALKRLKKILYDKYIKYIDAVDNGIDMKMYINDENKQPIFVRSLSNIVNDFETFEDAHNFIKMDFDNFMLKLTKSSINFETVYKIMSEMPKNERILYTEEVPNVARLASEIEKELGLDLYFSISFGNEVYKIYAIPVQPDSFISKVSLCEKWRGLREDELFRVSGIKGGVFIHISGFMGINKTLDGAYEMCKKSIEYFESTK